MPARSLVRQFVVETLRAQIDRHFDLDVAAVQWSAVKAESGVSNLRFLTPLYGENLFRGAMVLTAYHRTFTQEL